MRLRAKLTGARERLRFRLWTAGLRRRLRRAGVRLVLDAPHGAALASAPVLELTAWGGAGDATLTLRLGAGVRIGRGVTLEVFPGGTNVLELGDDSEIGDMTRVQLRHGSLRCGPRTRIRSFVVLKCDGDIVTGGDNEISYGTILHCARRIAIGARTGIAERVSIVDSDHTADGTDTHFYNQPLRHGEVVLEDNVFVAAGSIITRDTRIGANSVVAAGSVVLGAQIPGGSLVAGSPARVVRALQPSSSA